MGEGLKQYGASMEEIGRIMVLCYERYHMKMPGLVRKAMGMICQSLKLLNKMLLKREAKAISRRQNDFPTLPKGIQLDVHARMRELLEEEKQYCDKGSRKHRHFRIRRLMCILFLSSPLGGFSPKPVYMIFQ